MTDPIERALDLLRPELTRMRNERDWVCCSIGDKPEKIKRYWAVTLEGDALERAVFALEDVLEMRA